MKILALEFSSIQRSVAVIEGAGGQAERRAGVAIELGERDTRAFALIQRALGSAGIEREQIECVAVGLGPGSYTGIRVSISIAQGWQLARGVRLLGISSVLCLAEQLKTERFVGRANLIVDAQRDEFYLAAYDFVEAEFAEVEPLWLAARKVVRSRADAGEVIIGPEADRWFSGARNLHPEAGTLARLAGGRADFIRGDQLEPIYLRATSFVKAPPPKPVAG